MARLPGPADTGMGNSFQSFLGSPNYNNFGNGFESFLGGLFGQGASPYGAAMNQYQQWANKGAGVQNPFLQGGQQAMGNYQNWLQTMQNPSQFINNLQSQYKQSPQAQFEQQQAMRAAQNAGSASGLLGSSPLTLQEQQNAANISSEDQNRWMQNVLGLNTQYGQGQANIMNTGANAANSLTNLYGNEAGAMGNAAFGQQNGQNQDQSNMFAGLFGMIPGLASLL